MFIWCLLWEMSERHKMWLHSPGWSRTQSSPVSAFRVLGFMGMYHHTPPHVLVLKRGQNYINHVEIGRIEVSVCLKTVHSLVVGGTDLNLSLIVEVTYNRHWCLLRSYCACHVLGTFVQRGFGDRRLDSSCVALEFITSLNLCPHLPNGNRWHTSLWGLIDAVHGTVCGMRKHCVDVGHWSLSL